MEGWKELLNETKKVTRHSITRNALTGGTVGAVGSMVGMYQKSDDPSDILEAGLVGATLGAGIGSYGARQIGKMTKSVK